MGKVWNELMALLSSALQGTRNLSDAYATLTEELNNAAKGLAAVNAANRRKDQAKAEADADAVI